MAFVRRKGNLICLVNNVRYRDKVRQLHLARLGQRARISDSPVMAQEILMQLRLLLPTIQVKLNHLDQGRARFSDNLSWDSRLARRRP
ncbi:MAG: hypothetical protein ACHQLQ_12800 [Candidatus Acidiferrales bacterium]